MAVNFSEASLAPELERLLVKEVERAVDAIADEAAEKLRSQIKAKTGQFAAALFSEFSMERQGMNLVITVKIKEGHA